ncbi:MAG: zinc ABC transporter substrate-binding protein ZnuA [Alphaproteobacteria bacterium]|nr:zinc ABC transporter substrate-binding protein ZnuA [Alphaproteobacteria bacterium]
MNFFQKAIFFGITSLFLSLSANADIKVVTTIKPLHSLISSVMDGVGEPSLIIEGTNNPHTFVFKPSHAQMLEEADIVFWVGEDLEAFLEKPLNSLAKNATKVSFMELTSIEKLKFREENIFDDHDDHDGHKDDDHDDHEDHDGHEDKHEDHEHLHGEFDAHIWLDPANAKAMVLEVSHELSELDPDNKNQYEKNAAKVINSLDDLINEVDSSISKDVSYVVFHDAYQYFENRFGVSSAGALTLNPDVLPGAKQIVDIQDIIQDKKIKCIFSEPQYNPKIIETLANDMNISTGVIDPLGAYLEKGSEMYNELILNIANSLKKCS